MATAQQIEEAATRRAGHIDRIKRHIVKEGYPPTMGELADATGVGRETIKKDLRVLADEGLLEFGKAPAGRAIRLTGHRVLVVKSGGASA